MNTYYQRCGNVSSNKKPLPILLPIGARRFLQSYTHQPDKTTEQQPYNCYIHYLFHNHFSFQKNLTILILLCQVIYTRGLVKICPLATYREIRFFYFFGLGLTLFMAFKYALLCCSCSLRFFLIKNNPDKTTKAITLKKIIINIFKPSLLINYDLSIYAIFA